MELRFFAFLIVSLALVAWTHTTAVRQVAELKALSFFDLGADELEKVGEGDCARESDDVRDLFPPSGAPSYIAWHDGTTYLGRRRGGTLTVVEAKCIALRGC